MTKHTITTAITTVALATVCACNKDNRDTERTTVPPVQTPITKSAPAEAQDVNTPITVTGCLQKQGGLTTTYIVTSVNEPSQKGIGTTGSGAAVAREQRREAANAYRVDARGDIDMDAMVGKQVRVSGTMTRRADLPDVPVAAPNQTEPAGKSNARPMEKIDKGDLAKIDDATISVVSDNCGGQAERSSGAKTKGGGGKKNRG
jgi:hypothetical protein